MNFHEKFAKLTISGLDGDSKLIREIDNYFFVADHPCYFSSSGAWFFLHLDNLTVAAYFKEKRDMVVIIVPGLVVVHESAPEWGAGKIAAVTASVATIEFSDGKTRKISSSHFGALVSSDRSNWKPHPVEAAPEASKPKRSPKVVKKK